MKMHWRKRIAVFVAVLLVASGMMTSVAFAAVPTTPTNLEVTAATNTSVSLSWTASSNVPTDYVIEYSTDNFVNLTSTFMDGVSTATTVTVTGLTKSTLYYFRVKAKNGSGTSAASTIVSRIAFGLFTPNDPATFKACPTGTAPAHGFNDIYQDALAEAVKCVKYYEVTKGTTATTYSPLDSVTRWQMALFLTRMAVPAGITLPNGLGQGFTDIANKSTEIQTAINQIKQLGITTGTTATTFSPDSNVTREQMALFIDRLLKKSPTGPGGNEEYVSGTSGTKEIKSLDTDHNYDDMDDVYLMEGRTAVVNLFNLGITDDLTATNYLPASDMTRSAMAFFMHKALDHTNARPAGVSMQADTYLAEGVYTFTISVTHRSTAFLPIADTRIDTFRFQHPTPTLDANGNQVISSQRFGSTGQCNDTVVTAIGLTRCTIDSGEQITDANGNLATFQPSIINDTSWDYWAWTAAVGTTYDNDVHASTASKITISTY